MRQVRAYQLSAVPSDFPVMLGCSDEELAHPDPYIYAQSVKVCEAAQLGLYDLSQDTALTPDDQHELGWALMGAALERLAALRESGVFGTDGGTP